MKKCICLAVLSTCGLALHAQSLITMHAPFEFVAAGKTLPAGDYRLEPVAPGVLLIAGEGAGSRVLALASMSPGSVSTAAAFDRTGAEPVLTSVTTSAGTWHLMSAGPSHAAIALRIKK